MPLLLAVELREQKTTNPLPFIRLNLCNAASLFIRSVLLLTDGGGIMLNVVLYHQVPLQREREREREI
jgi:hypothetical protein